MIHADSRPENNSSFSFQLIWSYCFSSSLVIELPAWLSLTSLISTFLEEMNLNCHVCTSAPSIKLANAILKQSFLKVCSRRYQM